MEQEAFQRILRRYLNGQASEEEERIINAWYEGMGKGPRSPLDDLEEAALEKRYWSIISAHIGKTRKTTHVAALPSETGLKKVARYPLGIAASLLCIMAFYFFLVSNKRSAREEIAQDQRGASQTWTHLANAQQTVQHFDLPDGSRISLEPQSRLKYASSFNQSRREVFLEGEALFEVSRDEQSPFLVYAKEVTTVVLGTSFRVKAYEDDKDVTVAVQTGMVSVYADQPDKKEAQQGAEIILTPNQQIIYNRSEKTMLRRIVEEPQPLPAEEKTRRMRFEEAPVKEIFKALERVYGVDIVFDESRFSSCVLTTSISDGGIFNRLDIICEAIGTEYTVDGDQIVIAGSGCD